MTKEERTALEAELNKRKDALPEDQKKYLFLGIGLHDTMVNGYVLKEEGANAKNWDEFQARVYDLLGVTLSFMNEEACKILTLYSKAVTDAAKEEEDER